LVLEFMMSQGIVGLSVGAGGDAVLDVTLPGPQGAKSGEWHTWGGDLASTR
jgi:hypothetical protein